MNRVKNKERKYLYAALFLICASVVTLWLADNEHSEFYKSFQTVMSSLSEKDRLVIDPGHGGIDGGAVSANGLCEKDINLAIAMKIRTLAKADGWNVTLTREKNQSVKNPDKKITGTEEKKSIRMMKTEDLLARKAFIDRKNPLLAVSIHLNSFKEDTSVRGAQVFYTNSGENREILEKSKKFGEAVQKSLSEGIGDGTNRKAMGKKDVRILKEPKVPTIIVECGFLSNEKEAELLKDIKYQEKLAFYIYKGILACSEKNPRINIPINDSKG